MTILLALALASLPAGGAVPDDFVGIYTLDEHSKYGCDPRFALTIGPETLRLRRTDFAIVMEEAIDSKNIHLWLHDAEKKDAEVLELHLTRLPDGKGSIVLINDAEAARAALILGKAPADAGVDGYFVRCPTKSD